MPRRKFCDKLGLKHKFEYCFPSVGGWIKYGPDSGKGSYRKSRILRRMIMGSELIIIANFMANVLRVKTHLLKEVG